jgi:diguanylate cyclase (GGDEF)-like protein
VLARKVSWRESGVMETENLITELILLLIGYTITVLWEIDPWMVVPALAPLILIYRALTIPQLKKEAQTDEKTGLWNARHFATLFTNEMERAKRFNRPLALIMADLDLLRNINNTYGHLAGDVVLSGIGKIIRETVREYDIAGRFGGEEFAIVLPEVGPEEAKALAERLREAVENGTFEVTTSTIPIHATMSIGISCFPMDADSPKELLHEADIAVYQAKLNGRNCVVCTTDVPHSLELGNTVSMVDRLASPYTPYTAAFLPKGRSVVASGADSEPVNQGKGRPQAPAQNTTTPLTSEYRHAPSANTPGRPSLFGASRGAVAESPATTDTVAASTTEQAPGDMGNGALPEQVAKANGPQPASSAQTPASAKSNGTNPRLGQRPTPSKRAKPSTSMALWIYVSTVIALGALLTFVRFTARPDIDLAAIAMLCTLAVIAELLQVDLYGPGTVSVSVAVTFAAALTAGIPGASCASAAIALVHYYRRRPAIYQTAFNWATHVISAAAPAIVMNALGLPLKVENLLLLMIPVAIAALAYYAIDTGLIATVISLSSGVASPLATWRERYRWLINHYLVLCFMGLFLGIAYTSQGPLGMIVFTLPVLMMHYTQRQYVERTEDSVRELQRMNRELTRANLEVVGASQTMQQLNEELLLTLSKIIDARDPWVSSHAAQVADYAVAIGMELGMADERLEPLRQAGYLHDIGKIGISEQVLHKPDKLTPEEYEYVKTHAALGGEFLEMVTGLRHLAPFVRHHHERWDGKGYPDGIIGEDIELEARILAVCDAAEAMASDRPYRKGMSLPEIIAEVERCAGTQFDPAVAAAFVKIAEQEREILLINSGQEMMRKHADNGYLLLASKNTGPLGKRDSGAMPALP